MVRINSERGKTIMNSTIRRASLGLWLGASAFLVQTMQAQTAPILSIQMQTGYAGITVTGTVNTAYAIQATTNLAVTNGWMTLTNVVLPASPWVHIDYASPGMAKRFYRASVMVPNAPAGMVFIPAGTFTMGSPSTELDRYSNEGPQTQVTISQGFWMGKYEVTQGEYQAVMGSNPSAFPGDLQRPVEMVSWVDATNYCGKLTQQARKAGKLPSGYVYRLPTEAEWEYGCRAETTTRFGYGDDPSYTRLGNYAWYDSNSGQTTYPVGRKQPNAWGLYDMYGNVWEWCLDWYGPYPGGSVTVRRDLLRARTA
jgi:formylglycine-generating enzyme required for sulfatase activity